MNNYFLRRILEMERILGEFKAYFQERQKATERILAIKSKKEPERDPGSNSYLLPDGMDPDYYIDMIENSARGAEQEGGADMPALKEGSITKRKDGRWMGRYYEHGIQKCVYARTKPEIIQKMKAVIADKMQRDKDSVISKKMKLSNWVDTWIDVYKAPKLKASSLANITFTLVKSLKDSPLAQKEVSKITPIDLERFLNSIESKSMRARVFVHLRECFDALVRNRCVKDNVCDLIDRVRRPQPRQKNIPTFEEMERFMEWLKQKDPATYRFARLISVTGLRKGEALALTWKDVDFISRTIKVSKSFDLTTKTVATPKTRTAHRIIPMFSEAEAVLSGMVRKGAEIFQDVSKQSITKIFAKKAREFGLTLSLHGLRHYFATQCLEAKIEEKIVQKWLGHTKYEITINTYSHINHDFELEAITAMAEFWGKKKH